MACCYSKLALKQYNIQESMLVQYKSRHYSHLIEMQLSLVMVQLTNCLLGVKQQSITFTVNMQAHKIKTIRKHYLERVDCCKRYNINSNMTSFFRFVNKRVIYRLSIISLAHAPVHVTDFPFVNVHVEELSSARIWQHKLCATLFANVNINYRLPIKVYYRICTLRHIRIEIIHGNQNVF